MVKKGQGPKFRTAVRLGDVAAELLAERLAPQQARFEAVVSLWEELLPENLCRHCKIVGISGGDIQVMVESGSYANELRWCSGRLLEEFKRRCPEVRVRRIKLAIG